MYNSEVVCKVCGWKQIYDKDQDIHHIAVYVYCPICKQPLEKKPYSPNY